MEKDGVMLGPGEGERIAGAGATLKVAMNRPSFASMFESTVPPGYDVGAHVHTHGEEVFFIIKGQLDVLAFEPVDRSIPDWHEWTSADGKRYLRGGPGAFMYVPPGVPHAFGNPTQEDTVMFFQSSAPGGHENYFRELAELLRNSNGRPSEDDMVQLRRKYDMEQITQLKTSH